MFCKVKITKIRHFNAKHKKNIMISVPRIHYNNYFAFFHAYITFVQ